MSSEAATCSVQDTDTTAGESIVVARQPIYDRALRLHAYEILFRSVDQSPITDGEHATSEVIVNTLMDIGLERLVGRSLAFVNMTRRFLTGELPLPPMSEQVVLEVLEDIEPDDAVIAGLQQLSDAGYRIALDDFVYAPKFTPLIEIADIIKIDVMALSESELAEQVAILRPFNVQLLAEKVETADDMKRCEALGFDLYQGYYFCKPDLVTGARPTGNRLIVLELLSKLQNQDTEPAEIETLIARDATLVYRLLRYINSASFGLRSTVTSIRRALTLVGRRGISQWASLILMMRLAEGKPDELMVTGMVRAKMCEIMGDDFPGIPSDEFFTVGLFSILDALMDKPLTDILEMVPISNDARRGLLKHEGPLGETLAKALCYEQGDTSQFESVDVARWQRAYLDALQWNRELSDLAAS